MRKNEIVESMTEKYEWYNITLKNGVTIGCRAKYAWYGRHIWLKVFGSPTAVRNTDIHDVE